MLCSGSHVVSMCCCKFTFNTSQPTNVRSTVSFLLRIIMYYVVCFREIKLLAKLNYDIGNQVELL